METFPELSALKQQINVENLAPHISCDLRSSSPQPTQRADEGGLQWSVRGLGACGPNADCRGASNRVDRML
ncbi:hypothetical protein SRHO_G00330830 [Serrasalmus rhombeus]